MIDASYHHKISIWNNPFSNAFPGIHGEESSCFKCYVEVQGAGKGAYFEFFKKAIFCDYVLMISIHFFSQPFFFSRG